MTMMRGRGASDDSLAAAAAAARFTRPLSFYNSALGELLMDLQMDSA
jgi:hypothetical protein